MATNSSNALNLLNPATRPVEARNTREFSPKNEQDFGAQFKSEMNKAQQAKPAENREAKSADKAAKQQAKQDAAAQDGVNSKPVADEVKKTADAAGSEPEKEDNPEQTAASPDGNVNALLAMMQVVNPQAATPPLAPTPPGLDVEKGQGELLAVAEDGAKNSSAKLPFGVADATDDALTQDDASRRPKSELAVLGADSKASAAANIAATGAVLPHELSTDDALKSKELNTFADALAIKMNPSAMSATGFGQSNGIQSTTAQMTTAAAHAASNAVASHYVETPVQDARWGDAVAQRVSMMLSKQEQQIEMQLNPPNLGPMEVRLNLGNEQASVIFTSQHAAVREALAAATPKLTALLADQGIVLQNVQVASDSLHQHQQNQHQQQQANSFELGSQTARFGGVNASLGSQTIERVVNLSDLRIPAGSTRVSLFV
ncbi:flagellar hook-length control protein FliK [Chitinibacter bivalviorum]|uniref:Flagellar hook-length control protein FliK n=1 Tax=Chitinibacter bivalviorum TaxID=2739434 RepID=A0A7H9BDU8_9NEIS|nr:flagellar hook-length control protein FliK [Chitinibacter bivalviorum]QLG86789.1 flagellar hook-length control protein FliK [Chitinibacter bivalviorum]